MIIDGIDCSPENVREWIAYARRLERELAEAKAETEQVRLDWENEVREMCERD